MQSRHRGHSLTRYSSNLLKASLEFVQACLLADLEEAAALQAFQDDAFDSLNSRFSNILSPAAREDLERAKQNSRCCFHAITMAASRLNHIASERRQPVAVQGLVALMVVSNDAAHEHRRLSNCSVPCAPAAAHGNRVDRQHGPLSSASIVQA